MQTTLNGQPFTFDVPSDTSAVDIIRDHARLTGTKLVCGSGVCGACTILCNGTAVNSCILPATALHNATIETIEGLSTPDLHPIQRAFMAQDALQCGFCTPGFVVEGIAFYERWQTEHGTAEPDHETIANALAGHLCRCAAYPNIYTAIQSACTGAYDDATVVHSPRVEAQEKVTGAAVYTVDVALEGQLEGAILRSPHPHARVLRVDTSGAMAVAGVKGVVELLTGDKTVRYVGQEIAAVAAVDRRAAHAALAAIRVEYEILPAAIGMDAARQSTSPEIFPHFRKPAVNSGESVMVPGRWNRNVRRPIMMLTASRAGTAKSRIEKARQHQDPYLFEATFCTSAQSHTTLEPHAAVAHWHANHLTVYLSTQAVHRSAKEIARHYQVQPEQVTVICNHIGGGFGAKTDIGQEAHAAIQLSKATGKPVRVVLERWEDMTVGGYRPAGEIQMALLSDASGKMQALSAHAYSDAGVGIGSQIATMMGLLYQKSPRDLVDYDVVNHVASGKPFRGPNGPLSMWALEQAIDEIAHRLGTSPITLRRQWDDHTLRHKLYDWAETIPTWRDRAPVAADKGRFRRGIGVAIGQWLYLTHSSTEIEVFTTSEGIGVRTAAQDMGNGTRTVLATAIQEIFGIPFTEISVEIGSSDAPRGPMSAGSRTTSAVYGPTLRAAQQVREKLFQIATQQIGLQNAEITSGGVQHRGGCMPWREIVQQAPPQSVKVRRGGDAGLPAIPLVLGSDDLTVGRGFTGAVHLTEIEVDMRLGKIRPLTVWGGLAVGRIFVPTLARSQAIGGIIQGLGYALYEQKLVDVHRGNTITTGLEEYRLPGIGDTPEIEIHFLEEGFEHAQGGGVGMSELATVPIAASVGNALFHATGHRFTNLPILPSDILNL
jgi:xanthine dehydrogenase YagR molybdenum-binding subunit